MLSIAYNTLMDDKDLLLKLGAKIRIGRLKKQLSQEELAALANVNTRSVSQIERGETNIRFTTLCKIFNALDYDLSNIIN